MKVAITGGTGFVGSHLARSLVAEGQDVVLLARGKDTRHVELRSLKNASFVTSGLDNPALLADAFEGCHAVAHCAGINREIGDQTYQRVHVEGTKHVVEACRRAGVHKIVLMSFLRARPNCGSRYHESKWEAEELVRNSGLDFTIFKAGMVYGRGDHMLDHLTRSICTLPVFARVGLREKPIRPLAIDDLVIAFKAALVGSHMSRETLAITGAEQLYLTEAIRRVASVLGRRVYVIAAPVWLHEVLARIFEWTMKVPLVARSQLRILAEGVVEPMPPCPTVPADLVPRLSFTPEQIRRGVPECKAFGLADLRCAVR